MAHASLSLASPCFAIHGLIARLRPFAVLRALPKAFSALRLGERTPSRDHFLENGLLGGVAWGMFYIPRHRFSHPPDVIIIRWMMLSAGGVREMLDTLLCLTYSLPRPPLLGGV